MYVYQGSARRDVILCINCTRRVQKQCVCMYVWRNRTGRGSGGGGGGGGGGGVGESVEEEAVQLYSSDKASARGSVPEGVWRQVKPEAF